MTPLHDFLKGIFEAANVKFTEMPAAPVGDRKLVTARLSGDAVPPTTWLKSDERVCNISVPVGSVPSTADLASFAVALLTLNFRHPFGRVSIVELENEKGLFVVCETMFFVRSDDSLKSEVRERLVHLNNLRSAVKALLDQARSS
jgi:hypothetical protein